MQLPAPTYLHPPRSDEQSAWQGRARAPIVVRTVRRGAETIAWRQRAVRVDVDVYVVVGGDEPALLGAEAETESLRVELAGDDDGAVAAADFTPATRSMAGAVGGAIAEAARQRPGARCIVVGGAASAALRAELVAEERALRARADRIACAKAATRETLFRRVLLSADFIQSHFAEPRPGDLVHRESIARTLGRAGNVDTRRSADMHVCRIRRKLRDVAGHGLVVETVYGRGYLLRMGTPEHEAHEHLAAEWSV
jgi:hypothetical protein